MGKKLFTLLLGFSILVVITAVFSKPSIQTVNLKGEKIVVEVADTVAKQIQGLSGRASMKNNEGMLFVFKEEAIQSFWMKDMQFSLDILWIDENKIIVGIERNVSPDTFPQTFSPYKPALYVLELNAGWTEKHQVVAGDVLSW